MNSVNKTLYIPLYGKAYVSRKALFLDDKKAEEIWDSEGFHLKGKSKSKWLAYYMGIRSAVFDDWTKEKIKENFKIILKFSTFENTLRQKVFGKSLQFLSFLFFCPSKFSYLKCFRKF